MEFADDVLMAAEARHRVGNQLAVAAGALRLAAEGALSGSALSAAIVRLDAAAEVNALLCRAPSGATVPLGVELERLCAPLARVAALDGWEIRLSVDALSVGDLTAGRAMMLVHELVANSLRHAAGAAARLIHVEVTDEGGVTTIGVADGGAARTWSRPGGQGGRIVDALARAMGGTVLRGPEALRSGVEVVMPSLRSVAPVSPAKGRYVERVTRTASTEMAR